MAVTVTCTPGGSSDNSYVTVAQALAYFTNTLRETTYTGYTTDQKAQAVIQATAQIERLGGDKAINSPARALFEGEPYDVATPQALHFPRTTDLNNAGAKVIPQGIKDAVCEQAYYLLTQTTSPDLIDRRGLQAQGVAAVSIDGLSESYRGGVRIPLGIAPLAWDLVKTFIRRGFATVTGPPQEPSGSRFRAYPS